MHLQTHKATLAEDNRLGDAIPGDVYFAIFGCDELDYQAHTKFHLYKMLNPQFMCFLECLLLTMGNFETHCY